MSKYTTELGYIVKAGFDLGMKDYPIFSEEYRQKLNEKIINHYYFHEIGFETANRFKHYLNATLNEIMPYYNKLLKSELIKINPLLSFERNSISNKESKFNSNEENLINGAKESSSNSERNSSSDSSKNIEDNTTQDINNITSLDNSTNSNTNETQNNNNETLTSNSFNSSKNVDGNNSSSETDVFYDTPNGSLGSITDSTYATTVNKKDGNNTIDENETLVSGEDSNKKENNISNLNSDTTNTTKTDTSSNTSNSTINNINETMVNGIEENSVNNNTETSTTSNNGNKNSTTNENNVITENGYEVPVSELVLKYRETFLNIDLMIIKELKDLFMMIY